jgi:tetratricopeptide (TPR) repeat protein
MNKKQFTEWMNNITETPKAISVEREIEKYPYCMLFHLIQSMKINTIEHHSVLAVLHPCRKKLAALLLQREESVAEFRNKEDLLDILQKRLDELNKNSDTKQEQEQEQRENSIYESPPSVSLDELVEKFNNFSPKISSMPMDIDDETDQKDLGKSSITDNSEIISETLAELYYSQGAYDKALKVYEALMQKYPKKSDTFAKIIQDINSNTNNTN